MPRPRRYQDVWSLETETFETETTITVHNNSILSLFLPWPISLALLLAIRDRLYRFRILRPDGARLRSHDAPTAYNMSVIIRDHNVLYSRPSAGSRWRRVFTEDDDDDGWLWRYNAWLHNEWTIACRRPTSELPYRWLHEKIMRSRTVRGVSPYISAKCLVLFSCCYLGILSETKKATTTTFSHLQSPCSLRLNRSTYWQGDYLSHSENELCGLVLRTKSKGEEGQVKMQL